jgi:hypothetical protein
VFVCVCVLQMNRTAVVVATSPSAPAPRSSLLEVLPTSTFLGTVFPFLDFRSVGQLLTVSRVWQDLLTHELAWKSLCDQLRQDLVYVAPLPTPLRSYRDTFLQSFRFFPVWNPHRAAATGADDSDLPLLKSKGKDKDQGRSKGHAKVQESTPFSIQVLVRFRPRGAVLPEPPVPSPAERAASAKGADEDTTAAATATAAAASDDDKENGPARSATNAGMGVLVAVCDNNEEGRSCTRCGCRLEH